MDTGDASLDLSPAADRPRPSAVRGGIVLGVIALALFALVGRVAHLQTVQARQSADRVDRQQHGRETLHARRGSIFDRAGLLLAASAQENALFVDPKFLHEQWVRRGGDLFELDLALERVAALAHQDADAMLLKIGRDPTRRYVRLAGGLDGAVVEEIRNLRIPGVGFEPDAQRYYPMGDLAAHVLGAVGTEEKGLEGLESRHHLLLAGVDGRKRTLRDKRRRPIGAAADGYVLPRHGTHLVLTVDANLQRIVEEELANTCNEYGPGATGSVVLMDPTTGDILSLANYPTYLPQFLSDSTPDARRNRAIVDPYEPGSVIKPFIVAGLLDRAVTRRSEVMPIDGRVYRTSYGRRITDVHGYKDLTVWDVLVKSSNVGMAMLGEKLEPAELRAIIGDFGFGRTTGLGLPGEHGGMLLPLRRWTKYSRDSLVQGYEMMATPVQLARAMSAIANGGRLVTPRIVEGYVKSDGSFVAAETLGEPPEVIRPETAATMRRILADVMVRGTGQRAKLEHWNVFGKTGTAHRAVDGRYNDENYAASFIGGAPFESPRLVIVAVIQDPNKEKAHYGGIVTAPMATRILQRSLEAASVPHSPPLPPIPADVVPKLYEVVTAASD